MTTKKSKKKPARKAARKPAKKAVKRAAPIASALPPVGLPKVGEVFEGQGGVFAGLVRDEDGTVRALVVPTDPSCTFDAELGCYGKDVKGADSKSDGRANTQAFADAGSAAAKKVLALNVAGHADFYIPSRRELAICEANVGHLFDKVWHWSSTQYSSYYAWVQNFYTGLVDTWSKGTKGRVRAVRSLVIR